MAVNFETIPLAGGLDEASGKTDARAGRLLSCANFEVAFGTPGYRRIAGYERFDGRAAPSDAVYHRLAFDTGVTAIAVGETVTGTSGSGYVLRVDLDTGTWAGGDAAGTLILTAVTGSWANNDAIQVSAVTRATASAASTTASASAEAYATDLALARTYYRDLIAAPTGFGAILGVAIFNDVVYCMRNADANGVTATLWKSSTSGWTSVRAGLRGSGTMRTVNASYSGTGGDLAMYVVDGANRCFKFDGTTFTFAPIIYSTDGTSASNVTPGAGAKAFTTEAGRGWTTAHTVRVYSATDAGKYMVGVVASYAATTLTVTVASFSGAAATDWHICREDAVDRPFLVTSHKNHLFLGYPRGQLQYSDLGAPFTFGSSAGVVGLGDEMVGLLTLRSDVLAIFQESTISVLYGSGETTWELKQHSRSANTRADSAQDIGGNAIYLNDAGVVSLVGSDAFGDFDAANIAGSALVTLRRAMLDYKTTSLIKTDSQYRIYGADKEVLVMSWAGAMPDPSTASFTRLVYLDQPVCSAVGTVNGTEFVAFGTDDGYVMHERVGTNFDGEAINSFLRTSYWHQGAPHQKKRYRKLTIDCDAAETVSVHFKLDFDFSSPEYASGATTTITMDPAGGLWGSANWNEFYWSNPEATQLEANIEGVGRFMSLLLWADGDFEGFSAYNMSLQFSPLEIKR